MKVHLQIQGGGGGGGGQRERKSVCVKVHLQRNNINKLINNWLLMSCQPHRATSGRLQREET